MDYYKNANGDVFAFDADQTVPAGMFWMTPEQVDAHLNPEPTAEQIREAWKAQRASAVEAIKVTTTSGNTFDGDEISQGRMARAVIALQAAGVESVTWVLADNSVIQATVAELSEALSLAGAAQAALWVQN